MMDSRAAEDFHKTLLLELKKRPSAWANLWWIPAIGLSAYFTFNSYSGLVLGTLVGYAFCATLSRLDRNLQENVKIEFLRHLHNHTDEAERGRIRADIEESVSKATKRWFD